MISTMTIRKENLGRKNFPWTNFFKSNKATELGINNETDDLCILNAGMKTMDKLQEIREYTGLPITITNIYRCPELNKAVKGSPSSWHMQGLASDSNLKGHTPLEYAKKVKESGISVDKCLIENGCLHMQFCLDDSKNRNIFAEAKIVNGEWKTTPLDL
jgi:zinc D-Ala-D-Ala carboxypeptidase